jgi:hypothetical protein
MDLHFWKINGKIENREEWNIARDFPQYYLLVRDFVENPLGIYIPVGLKDTVQN